MFTCLAERLARRGESKQGSPSGRKTRYRSMLHYSYLSVSIGSKRAAFSAGYMLNKTPHATEKEIMIIMLLTSTTVGISLK